MNEVSMAARFRVYHREAHESGGLRVAAAVRRLRDLYRDTTYLLRGGRWRAWFLQAFVHNLKDAADEFERRGVTIATVEDSLGASAPQPHTRQQARRIRGGTQRASRATLVLRCPAAAAERMRHKLERWRLPLFPRIQAARAMTVLARLRRLVPPRVTAAVLRTWYNGWCTTRRFQSHSPCRFGCRLGEDSVDHYMRCSRLHGVGKSALRLQVSHDMGLRAVQFLLLEPAAALPDATLTRRALHLAAAYRLHCHCRREPPIISDDVLARALGQAAKEAAMGHAKALQVLDSTWISTANPNRDRSYEGPGEII